ncbi:hypothetical protein A0H81_10883 [Grifola frondosa]|uniref:Uncharacterized protein n=1 Tax=Grifola frondosa TaxID=5627 RepID=A0A1C7LX49_GRIFR|nr:hypothetical protein A0H81_10883 [Grifola frondosa]
MCSYLPMERTFLFLMHNSTFETEFGSTPQHSISFSPLCTASDVAWWGGAGAGTGVVGSGAGIVVAD